MKEFLVHPLLTLALSLQVAALLSPYSEASEAIQLIDFSATPDGDFQGYSERGVTFFAIDGVLTSTKFLTTPEGSRGLYGYDGDNEARGMTAVFDTPVRWVSVDLGDYNADPDNLLLEAYDNEGLLIDRQTLAIPKIESHMQTLEVRGTAIHRVIFGSEGAFPNSVFADDFRFLPIPEPSSTSLGFTCVAAIARFSRRRQVSAGA